MEQPLKFITEHIFRHRILAPQKFIGFSAAWLQLIHKLRNTCFLLLGKLVMELQLLRTRELEGWFWIQSCHIEDSTFVKFDFSSIKCKKALAQKMWNTQREEARNPGREGGKQRGGLESIILWLSEKSALRRLRPTHNGRGDVGL